MIGVITYFRFFLKKLLCDWRNHANKANHANHKISFENDVMLMFPFKNCKCLTHSAAVVFTEMKTSVSSVRLLTVLCYAMIVMIMISSPWTWAGRYLRTATKVHERRMRVYVRCAVTKHKDQNRNQSRNGFFSQVKNTPTEESYFLPLCFVTILSIQSSLQHFAHASNISKIRNLQS